MGAIFLQLTIIYLGLSAFCAFVGVKIDSELQGFARYKYIAKIVVLAFFLCASGFFLSCAIMAGEEVHAIVFGIAVYFGLLISFLALAFVIRSRKSALVNLRNGLFLSPFVLPIAVYTLFDVFPSIFAVDMSNSY